MTDQINNPYWGHLAGFVTNDRTWRGPRRVIRDFDGWALRKELVPKYTWTVTDPDSVEFVARHCTKRVIDPMAGTGYWAYLLGQLAVRVTASDADPPAEDDDSNFWHPNVTTWVPVRRASAVDAATLSDTTDTLLISWPPDGPAAFKTLSAFGGNRLIYIGEHNPDTCADDVFFALLDSEWTLLAGAQPVQFDGMNDFITVYDRNQPPPSS